MKLALRLRAVPLALAVTLAITGCGGGKKRAASAEKMTQLGQTKIGEGDFEGALADLTQAARLDPKNANIQHSLALAYWGKANLLKDDAMKLEAEKVMLHSFALKEKNDEPIPGDWHNNLGALYVDLRRWPDAVVHLQKALKDPEYRTPERPYNNLAKASLEQRKYEEALKYAETALRIQPRFCMALMNKGEAAKALKRNEDALDAFLKVISIEECSAWPEPYLRVGMIYYEARKTQDAKKNLLKAREADPDGPIGKEADRYLRTIGN